MRTQEIKVQIQKLIDDYKVGKTNSFYIEGDAEGLWFIMHNATLGDPFNKSKTNVMVKFRGNRDKPVILVPNNLSLQEDSNVCEYLLEKTAYIQGWKLICPILIHYVRGELFTLMYCLAGVLANPCLCVPSWCEEKRTEEKKIQLFLDLEK